MPPNLIKVKVVTEKLPVFSTLKLAFKDCYVLIGEMPRVFGILLFIQTIYSIATRPLIESVYQGYKGIDVDLWMFALAAILALLIAPIIVIIHRRIIMVERFNSNQVRQLRRPMAEYAALFLMLNAVSFVSNLPLKIVDSLGEKNPIAGAGWGLVAFAITILIIFWMVRLMILFPAVAVCAPIITVRSAARASKGMFWRIFVVTSVPVFSFIAPAMIFDHFATGFGLTSITIFLFGLGGALAVFGGTAALSRVYMWRSTGPYGRRRHQSSLGSEPS